MTEDNPEWAPLDFTKLFKYVIEVIEQDNMLELGAVATQLFSMQHNAGDHLIPYYARMLKLVREMKELNPLAIITDILLLSRVLHMTYNDPRSLLESVKGIKCTLFKIMYIIQI